MRNYRMKIIGPAGIRYTEPYGIKKLAEKKTRQTGNYSAAYLRSLDGDLTFLQDDFAFLLSIIRSNLRYNDVKAVIYIDCGAGFVEKYRGFLNIRECTYNESKYSIRINILLDDALQKYNDTKDTDYNLFDLTATRINDVSTPTYTGGNFDNGLPLYNILLLGLKEMLGFASVKSDFFGWNPDDASYVIGHSDKLHNLVIFQQSDIVRAQLPGYTAATKLTASIGDIVDDLCVLCNLQYDIDTNGNFRIEHVSWWDTNTVTLDLTQSKYAQYIKDTKQFSYDNSQIARREVFTNPRSVNPEFVGLPIEYDNAFVRGLGDKQDIRYDCKVFSVDLDAILALNEQDSSNYEGVVLLAIKSNREVEVGHWGFGVASTSNRWLSLSQRLDDYHKDGRIFESGMMNGLPTDFDSTKWILKRDKISIPVCCTENINPRGRVQTDAGLAVIAEISEDTISGIAELTLLYQDTATVTLAAPVAVDDIYVTDYNTTLDSDGSGADALIDNDTDATAADVESKATDGGGTVAIKSDGHFIYTPPANYYGIDSFEYTALDANNHADIGKARIVIRTAAGIYLHLVVYSVASPLYPSGTRYRYGFTVYHYADAAGIVPLNLDYYGLVIHYSQTLNGSTTTGSYTASDFYSGIQLPAIYTTPQTFTASLVADPAYTII